MSFIAAFFAWLAMTLGVQANPCSGELNASSPSPAPPDVHRGLEGDVSIYNGY